MYSRNHDVRVRGAKNLRSFIEGEARELDTESFTAYIAALNKRIFDLVNSSDATDKMGGILIIGKCAFGVHVCMCVCVHMEYTWRLYLRVCGSLCLRQLYYIYTHVTFIQTRPSRRRADRRAL